MYVHQMPQENRIAISRRVGSAGMPAVHRARQHERQQPLDDLRSAHERSSVSKISAAGSDRREVQSFLANVVKPIRQAHSIDGIRTAAPYMSLASEARVSIPPARCQWRGA